MIEQRNGRWRARLRLQGHPQLSKTFATQAAARQWHQQIEDASKTGTLADVLAAETTFGAMLAEYELKITPKKRGHEQEGQRINALRRCALADLHLSAITRRVLREHRDRRCKTICGGTWNRELSLITQVLRHAVAEHDAKLDVRSITEGLRGKESPGRTGRISRADEDALLAAAPQVGPWVAAMIGLSLALGTRRTELWSLTHGSIDRQAMEVHVRGTKTEGSDRVLPISTATLALVDSLPRSLTDDRVLWQASRPSDLTYAFRRTAHHAKLPHLCLHLTRHECLSRLAEAGASIPLLRAMSGHATLSMLQRYARPEASGLRALIAA